MPKKENSGRGKGAKKYGRNKRPVNSAMSAYVRGKITFESYIKQSYINQSKRNQNKLES